MDSEEHSPEPDLLAALCHLRCDRSRGPAPHKPLLLLVLCDLAEEGLLSNPVALTPELASRFLSYWPIVSHRRPQKPDVRLPFYHLSGDGIWTPLDKEGNPTRERDEARFAQLPADLLRFLQNPASRECARNVLIAKYFQPSERIALYESMGLPVPTDLQLEEDAAYKSPSEAKLAGREARFRKDVVAAYDYTCALTGYRLVTIAAGSIVDAAHIHQFKDSRNNEIRNGLALSKNAHWAFDQGLWSIADDFRVLVATGAFAETAEHDVMLLRSLAGKRILLPKNQSLWPNPVHLAWHRRKKFLLR